jgi:hypothetical protein
MELLIMGWIITIVILSVWELVWKAFGLWHSAKNDDKLWFVLIMILNTAGILPIVYLLTKTKFFKKKKK